MPCGKSLHPCCLCLGCADLSAAVQLLFLCYFAAHAVHATEGIQKHVGEYGIMIEAWNTMIWVGRNL